ncbi:hypothetical protein LMG26841_05156 [Achromobacter dolens]|uniref:Uncharacterized protein n=1 Tax=Achromobacter dolens TaxID=1287738 RepID=A0A6S7EM21_9BURK|nr:hypothetical protein [Achromobacter dolens]CAB3914156.1 hypothetical protein LMG26841_05156 [Achromobacter dolens]
MTNSYDVAHGLSQVHPGPEEPVEIAQQPGAAPATGNTARDQEMYAAGIRTGEENAKHNAAIRASMPDGWKLVPIEPTDEMEVAAENDYEQRGETFPDWKAKYRAMLAAAPVAPSCPTCNDQGAVGNILTAQPCPDCAAPGVSTVEDKPTAWMDPDTQDVISAERKASWLNEYGAGGAAKAATYTRALGDMRPAPAAGDAQTAAARDVLAEHQRQISAEGWTAEKDDTYARRELADAAAQYVLLAGGWTHLDVWPWARSWLKPTTPRRNLVKAGALILAEIERLDRAAQRKGDA